jgi:hypothetical protein
VVISNRLQWTLEASISNSSAVPYSLLACISLSITRFEPEGSQPDAHGISTSTVLLDDGMESVDVRYDSAIPKWAVGLHEQRLASHSAPLDAQSPTMSIISALVSFLVLRTWSPKMQRLHATAIARNLSPTTQDPHTLVTGWLQILTEVLQRSVLPGIGSNTREMPG